MTLNSNLGRIADQFPWGRVLVVGDVIADEWLSGSCLSLAREAPVPTVSVRDRDLVAGGAGNTAVNVAALGGRVRLLCAIGQDHVGGTLEDHLRRRGVEVSAITVPGRQSMAKRRVVVGGQVVARFDEGDADWLPNAHDGELAERLCALADDADVVVVADYGLGTCAGPQLEEAVTAVSQIRPVLVDAHDVRRWAGVHPTLVTPNWGEIAAMLDVASTLTGPARLHQLRSYGHQVLEATGARAVVATLDGDGAALITEDDLVHLPTRRVDNPHSTGAGDTLTAAVALSLAVGAPITSAVEIGVAAATVVVQRPGTATCSVQDLFAGPDSALLSAEGLIAACREHRVAGRRIGFTNGCFDVLHAGHVAFLREAAAECDVLVVALNSDAGVRSIKGPGRPVNSVTDRAAVLAAMDTVDHLVCFDGIAPTSLIEAVRPDVYVKGADHDVTVLPEARVTQRLGGRVVTVPLLPDRSTSGVIEACAIAQRSSA
jgi:D-beta-D-heptose 7-phosphate kinase / D-beta-D-heptose 1-phosphate adenosyltransferase